jgi:hypothetical protein
MNTYGPGDKKDKYDGYPSIEVGGRTMYPDITGGLHTTPSEAIYENMRREGDFSRGTSGGCHQDPDRIARDNERQDTDRVARDNEKDK